MRKIIGGFIYLVNEDKITVIQAVGNEGEDGYTETIVALLNKFGDNINMTAVASDEDAVIYYQTARQIFNGEI